MYIDELARFSNAQAVTVDAKSEDIMDLYSDNTLRDIGIGTNIYLYVIVTTTFTSSATPTLTVNLDSDSTANLATSATTHLTSGAVALASLTAGYKIFDGIALPPGDYERYLGLDLNVGAGGPMTAGAITAFLTNGRQYWKAYANAID